MSEDSVTTTYGMFKTTRVITEEFGELMQVIPNHPWQNGVSVVAHSHGRVIRLLGVVFPDIEIRAVNNNGIWELQIYSEDRKLITVPEIGKE